jgi:hypothetical protein
LVTIAGNEVLSSSHAGIVQNDPDSRGFVRHPPR